MTTLLGASLFRYICLEDVDVDVGHREHGPAHQHAKQSAEKRLEA